MTKPDRTNPRLATASAKLPEDHEFKLLTSVTAERPSFNEASLTPEHRALVDYWRAQNWQPPFGPTEAELRQDFMLRFMNAEDQLTVSCSKVWPGWMLDTLAVAWAEFRKVFDTTPYRRNRPEFTKHPGFASFNREFRPHYGRIESGYQQERSEILSEVCTIWDDATKAGMVVSCRLDGGYDPPSLEVKTHEKTREAAEALIRAFAEVVDRTNIYRGQQLTYAQQRIKFTKVETAAFDDIIMDRRVVDLVRANTVSLMERRDLMKRYKVGTTHSTILAGSPGCHAKGQGILLHTGIVKKVEDIVVGDAIMGADGQPQTVTELVRNRGNMVRIVPVKGDSFVVNDDHILTLITCKGERKGELVDISVKDYLALSDSKQQKLKLLRAAVNFGEDKMDALCLDSYFLGVLIGDGSLTHQIGISKPDSEIYDLAVEQAAILGLNVRVCRSGTSTCPTYYFSTTTGGGQPNVLRDRIRELGLDVESGLRFIPDNYKRGSRATRLQVLAGILDTDGHLTCGGYDYISKSEELASDVVFVARSLGLAAYKKQCTKSCQNGFVGTYYRVSISGNCSIVPCRIKRKIAAERRQIKNVLHTGFTVEQVGDGDYYGFSLDGDGRFLLDDFTVTHNTGKTMLARAVATALAGKTTTWVVTAKAFNGSYDVSTFYEMVRAFGPALVIFEDLDLVGQDRGITRGNNDVLGELLNQLSGTSANDDILTVASTNDITILDSALSDRPERLGTKIDIPLPSDQDRRRMFELFASNYDADIRMDPVGWQSIIKGSSGLTGDYCKAIIKAAVRAVILRDTVQAGARLTVGEPELRDALTEILRSRNVGRKQDSK